MLPLPPELLMLREAKHFDPNVCPPPSPPQKIYLVWAFSYQSSTVQCNGKLTFVLIHFTFYSDIQFAFVLI